MNQNRCTAFTLIELLVVIAIIAVLLSVLIPSLSAAREQAKSAVCLSNLKRLGIGLTMYVNRHADNMPPVRLHASPPTATAPYVNRFKRMKPRWQWFLDEDEVGPVIDPRPFAEEIAQKGGFDDKSVGAQGESGLMMTNELFVCPSLKDEAFALHERNGAYGYNYQYLGNSRQDSDPRAWDNFPVNLSRLRAAGQTVLFADARGGAATHGQHAYTLDPPRLASEKSAKKFGPGPNDVPAGLDRNLFAFSPVEMRHRKRGNVMFLDGHGAGRTLVELGYEVDENGHAVPIVDARGESSGATNKFFNGDGRDVLALTAAGNGRPTEP